MEEEQLAFEREKLSLQTELERQKLTSQSQLEREKLTTQNATEWRKLALERYKARLDYTKFVLGSVFVALAIAAIPPLFQLASAVLEYTKSNAERLAKQQAFRDDYNKEFINNGLNQDIELRIRFAQYLANVASEQSKLDWQQYYKALVASRDAIRKDIDIMEEKWRTLSGAKDRDEIEIAKIERHLEWAYKEVGYAPKNRSAVANPRVPEAVASPAAPTTIAPTATLKLQFLSTNLAVVSNAYTWTPTSDEGKKYGPVVIPAGFLTTPNRFPDTFSSVLPVGDSNISAFVLHDFLYWDQTKSRDAADDILRIALTENGATPPTTVTLIYQAIRRFGQAAWDQNAKKKADGEKRFLKEIPVDAITWDDLKKRPELFK
ncbi:hypothetical protein ACVW1C_000063 [Bradyrhizobium sp. USDA 4011]